jgi:RNA polymerase sigma-70 factor (ECF subfamily)
MDDDSFTLVAFRVNLGAPSERVGTMSEAAARSTRAWGDRDPGGEVVDLGVTETFDSFYLRELPRLVALARALTGSAAAAEDVAQDAMIAAYRRWDEVAGLDIPAAWVRRVCANRATSHLRRRSSEARAVLRLSGVRQNDPELPPIDADFWASVRRLPRRQAQAIALHYLYDMSVTDVALTLGCSSSSVKAHLVRGRSALARALDLPHEEQP